jgi:hypothetical protein
MIGRFTAAVLLAITMSLGAHGVAVAKPADVRIPSIGVNAQIKKVGIKNGMIDVGGELRRTLYTWRQGDPPCDRTGTTVYAGHAWRSGPGVADRWGQLRRGARISLAGCRFKVTSVQFWNASRPIGKLFRVDGRPRIVLIGCKADDYSKRTLVFARMVKPKKHRK